MVSKKTKISELSTGLGTLGFTTLAVALDRNRPPEEMKGVSPAIWMDLKSWYSENLEGNLFSDSFEHGKYFLNSKHGLNNTKPFEVSWTGPERVRDQDLPPADLVVNRLHSISCKAQSKILRNPSPTSLFRSALASSRGGTDWYEEIAPVEYSDLLVAATRCLSLKNFPSRPSDLAQAQRIKLKVLLERHWPSDMSAEVQRFVTAVSQRSSDSLASCLRKPSDRTSFYLRLLRHSDSPYFLLGSQGGSALRLRVDTKDEFCNRFSVQSFRIEPDDRGQPQVKWSAEIKSLKRPQSEIVRGHIEIRWSHGKFRQAPESKIYLDTPMISLPGYTTL